MNIDTKSSIGFFFSMMLFYVDEALIENLFKKHKIDVLEINESDKQKIVDSVINFFNSQYTNFGFGGPDFAEDIKRQEYFSHYRQLLRHLFNRLMLLLSRMDLSDENSKSIIPFLIDFLKASEDINHSSWSRITKYITKSIQSFSDKQIESVIELCLDSKNHRNGEDSLESICDIASGSGKFTISDSQFFNKILNIISTPCHSCNRIHNTRHILSLWNISGSELKPKVKEMVVKYLEDKFDGELYQRAVYKGILNRVQDSKLYLKFIEYSQKSCHPLDLKKDGSHWLMQSYAGFNCINCLAYLDSDFSDNNIQVIAEKSDYYNWLINFNKYNYANFDYTWITEVCPYYILIKLPNVIAVRNGIKEVLLKKFNKKLAKIYIKYFFKIGD